jgi:5'(3')-deoxyribonucleotidase
MDQCPLVKTNNNVEKMFGCQDFWSWLEFMPNAKETLEKLNEDFNLIICSIGTYKNIERKSKWIARNLPFIKNCILINNGDIRMDKSIVDMSDGILIDDVASNLELSNAKYKICFGKIYPWNEALPEGCLRATDWLEVKGILEGVIS